MLEFKPISIEDKEWISPLIRCENSKSADTAFGTMYLWSAGLDRYVARSHDRVVLMLDKDQPRFLFPFGCGDLKPAIEDMKEYANARSKPLVTVGMTENYLNVLDKLFPNKFEIKPLTQYHDYVYSAEKLATLSGKSLSSKRNHINSFEATYDWEFKPLSDEHIPDCIEMLNKWVDADSSREELDVFDERATLLRGLNEYKELGMYGGVLFADGKMVAFTMGEPLCDDTFVVHFEKAYSEVRGAYPMINREFVRYINTILPEKIFFNREDDMGLPNLRKAKESYKPVLMVEKYAAIWSD